MRYADWRNQLQALLSGQSQNERERALAYYDEMYSDMRDGGMSEEAATERLGSPEQAAAGITEDGGQCPAAFVSEGPVDAIELDCAMTKAELVFYDGENVRAERMDDTYLIFKAEQLGGKVTITHKSPKIRRFSFKNRPVGEMKIFIPRHLTPDCRITLAGGKVTLGGGEYGKIVVYVQGGALEAGEITCGDAELTVDAGKLEMAETVCHRLSAEVNAGKLGLGCACGSEARLSVNAGAAKVDLADFKRTEIAVTTGTARVTLAGSRDDYDHDVTKTLGSCVTESSHAGRDRLLKATVTLGSLNIDYEK